MIERSNRDKEKRNTDGEGSTGGETEGIEPEGAGAEVMEALKVTLPCGRSVLELLVAVIAVVLLQGHASGYDLGV